MTIAKAGTLLHITNGCYSSYDTIGFFVVLSDFEPVKELAAYLAIHPEEAQSYAFNCDRFLAQLIARGALLEITYGELHLGDYRRASEVRFTPVA